MGACDAHGNDGNPPFPRNPEVAQPPVKIHLIGFPDRSQRLVFSPRKHEDRNPCSQGFLRRFIGRRDGSKGRNDPRKRPEFHHDVVSISSKGHLVFEVPRIEHGKTQDLGNGHARGVVCHQKVGFSLGEFFKAPQSGAKRQVEQWSEEPAKDPDDKGM